MPAAAVTDARGEAVTVSLWEVAMRAQRGGGTCYRPGSSRSVTLDGSLLAVGGDGVAGVPPGVGPWVGWLAADYGNVSSLASRRMANGSRSPVTPTRC